MPMTNDFQRRIIAEAAKHGGAVTSKNDQMAKTINEAPMMSAVPTMFGYSKSQFEAKIRQLLQKMGFEKGITRIVTKPNGNMVLYFANKVKARDFAMTFQGMTRRMSGGSNIVQFTTGADMTPDQKKLATGAEAMVELMLNKLKKESLDNESYIFMALENLHEEFIASGGMKNEVLEEKKKEFVEDGEDEVEEGFAQPTEKELMLSIKWLESIMKDPAKAKKSGMSMQDIKDNIAAAKDMLAFGKKHGSKMKNEEVEEAYAHPDEKVLGRFYEKTGKQAFEYRISQDSWGKSHGYPHEVCVSRKDYKGKGDWRAANVKGTVCYIVTDEGEGGKPVVEKWTITKHIKYVKAEGFEADVEVTEQFKAGDRVKVPHKGKMVSGKIVRFDGGGTSKAQQHGGGYVVDVGEPASITVPKQKVQKEEVEVVEDYKAVLKGVRMVKLNRPVAFANLEVGPVYSLMYDTSYMGEPMYRLSAPGKKPSGRISGKKIAKAINDNLMVVAEGAVDESSWGGGFETSREAQAKVQAGLRADAKREKILKRIGKGRKIGKSVKKEEVTEEKMNNYIAFYSGKKISVQAPTSFAAQQKAAAMLKVSPKKHHMITVKLADVSHSTAEETEVNEASLPTKAEFDQISKELAVKKLRRTTTHRALRNGGIKLINSVGRITLMRIAIKYLGKETTRFLITKVPVVGLVLGTIFAANRLAKGEYVKAAVELVGGVATTLPGFGLPVALACDAFLAVGDVYKIKQMNDDFNKVKTGSMSEEDFKKKWKLEQLKNESFNHPKHKEFESAIDELLTEIKTAEENGLVEYYEEEEDGSERLIEGDELITVKRSML
jgi:hypothetical protein